MTLDFYELAVWSLTLGSGPWHRALAKLGVQTFDAGRGAFEKVSVGGLTLCSGPWRSTSSSEGFRAVPLRAGRSDLGAVSWQTWLWSELCAVL